MVNEAEANMATGERSAESFRQWLSRIEQDWLVIFDNADCDPRVVAQFMPKGNRGNILFTSRNPDMGGSNITRKTSANIEDMCQEEAISLLLKSAWLDESSPEMRQGATSVVDTLCYLPLAIDQAGAAIESGLCTIHDYRMYSGHRWRLMDYSSYQEASNYGRAVYATWDLSFAVIEARATGSDSVDAEAAKSAMIILGAFGFFHHDNIPEDIIKRAAEAPRNPQDDNNFVADRQASYGYLHPLLQQGKDGRWDPLFFREGIRVLLSLSLIKRSVTVVGNVYSMHPLVHLWSHDRMLPEERQSRCLSANTLLAMSITYLYTKEDYAFRRALIPHIKANQYCAQAGIFIPYDDEQCTRFGFALWGNGFWEDAEKLEVQVMETRSQALGIEHPDALMSMADLASTYWDQGRWDEAKELQVQVMEMQIRVLGAEHPSTLKSMANLATTHRDQGRWKQAEKLEAQVMETRSRVLGTKHLDTLKSVGNLASTYRDQGRWKEAEASEAQVMERTSWVLGVEHPDTLTSMGNLASTYRNQGRWKEAEKLNVQVMETRSRILGAEHPSTLTSMGNLASTYMSQGRWNEAEELQLQVMEISSHVLGMEHPDTLRTLANIAAMYWNQGQSKDAEKLEVQVMETRIRVLGGEHPDTLTSMVNLAFTWKSQGRDEEAAALLHRAVNSHIEQLGPDHPHTVASIAALTEWQS
jgi:tetratricopeptide (TPR) repeat protein